MGEIIKLPMCLMFRNFDVARIDMRLDEQMLMIDNLEIINNHLLPIYKNINSRDIYNWLISRIMPSSTRHYINIMKFIFNKRDIRLPYAQFVLSLATNGVSFSDNYWFNPESDIVFNYCGKTINFQQQTWQQICEQQYSVWSDTLNQFLFHDMLLVNCFEQQINTNNPIFTTNGNKEKLWFYDESIWWLEKRMETNQLNAEVECLSFFKSKGILTPDFKITRYDVSNKYLFLPETRNNGFNVIQKKRITSQNTQLIPINWFIKDDCNDDIKLVLKDAREMVRIDKKEFDKFENAIIEYLSNYHYDKIASSNFGFFVDSNDNAAPAVWSNVGYVNKNQF